MILLLLGAAFAKEAIDWSTEGDLRAIGSVPPDFEVDPDGTTVGQDYAVDARFRLGGRARFGEAADFRIEADLMNGTFLGDAWDLGPEDARHRDVVGVFDKLRMRRASALIHKGWMQVEGGLTLSHWGLGVLANDGAHDPSFGRSDFGDRVLRLRATASPFGETPLSFTLAGDRVVEDDTAEWAEGEIAWQAIASVLYGGEKKVGLYGVYRDQVEPDGRFTRAGVGDLWFRVPVEVGEYTLSAEGEGVLIYGSTDRAVSWTSPDELSIRSQAAAGQLEAAHERGALTVRGGWGSGDGDPDDDVSRDFSFDRDYDAGMVLFDEVSGALAQAAYDELTDPDHSAVPPEGVDTLVTEGAVKRAAFVQPVLTAHLYPWLVLRGGVMLAWSTAPIAAPFETFRNGGAPANHLGEATEGYRLGTEIDWAARFGGVEMNGATTELVVQGGHLLASEDMGGQTLTLLMATGRLRW